MLSLHQRRGGIKPIHGCFFVVIRYFFKVTKSVFLSAFCVLGGWPHIMLPYGLIMFHFLLKPDLNLALWQHFDIGFVLKWHISSMTMCRHKYLALFLCIGHYK